MTKYLIVILRIIIGGVFIWAGITKIVNPIGFIKDIQNYKLFPLNISLIIAIILPWVEFLCGICLLLGIRIKSSSFLTSFILALFIVIILITMIRGINIKCGCFGAHSGQVGWTLLIQDIVLFLMTFLTFQYDRGWLSIEKLSGF